MSPSPDTFTREAKPLRDWLPDLLSEDRAQRRRAQNAISAMWWGAPVADATIWKYTPKDHEAHRRAWCAAIAEILNDPSFPGPPFIEDTAARLKLSARLQRERSDLESKFLDADPPRDKAAQQAHDEMLAYIKHLAAERHEGQLSNTTPEAVLLGHVIECAGFVLLRLRDIVLSSLRDRDLSRSFAKGLEKLGTAAASFAPEVLEVSFTDGEPHLLFPELLAAIGVEDSNLIRMLADRAIHAQLTMATSAAFVLRKMGPPALRTVPSIVDDLLLHADATDRGDSILLAAASIGRHREDLFERVLAAARPAPARLQPDPGYPSLVYDLIMHRRAAALSALPWFESFADRAVPVLVDALDTFEEFDPDETYEGGNYGRVIRLLATLNPVAAAAAAPAIAARLRDNNGEVFWDAIRLLGRWGPLASPALPALHQLQRELIGADPQTADDPPDESDNPISWAISQISERA